MARLDIDRQNKLEPKRVDYAKNKIEQLGYEISFETDTSLVFTFKGEDVIVFPYSGWHAGKSINDGRGISNLLKQLTQ